MLNFFLYSNCSEIIENILEFVFRIIKNAIFAGRYENMKILPFRKFETVSLKKINLIKLFPLSLKPYRSKIIHIFTIHSGLMKLSVDVFGGERRDFHKLKISI